MRDRTQFVLDADVFIESKKRCYAFDICSGYWTALLNGHAAQRLCSIDRVRDELTVGSDDLAEWVESETPDGFFRSTDDPVVIGHFTRMMQWVAASSHYLDSARAEFATVADGWVAAYALTSGMTLVTGEHYNRNRKNKVPLPNLCEEFHIPCIDHFEMLRRLGVDLRCD